MKKMLLKFADNLLSREQMRGVKGGYGSGGVHCPSGISEAWCNNYWQNPCGPGCVSGDTAGYDRCMATCRACGKC